MLRTISLTVTSVGDMWTITHTNAALVTDIEFVRGHYDAAEVLLIAERKASGECLWRVTDDSLEAVIRSEVTGWDL